MESLKRLFFLLLIPALVFTGCKDEDEPTPVTPPVDSPYATMTAYIIANDLDLPNILDGWIISAPAEADLTTFLDGYTVLDIRGTDDYNSGHMNGAINSSLGTILDDAAASTKPVLVTCYTGQTAGHAVVALRLSGHPDAKVLKWGMSGWGSSTAGPWSGNSGDNGNNAIDNINWTTAAVATVKEFGNPTFTSTSTDPATILKERISYMLENGFKGVTSTDVLANPGNYFINNYWPAADVDHYGHIAGAFRIQPMSLATGDFKNLDPNETVVTYCWTGQTSSMITAYLTVLGYDAKSLKFGANNMIYSNLESHKYVPPSVDLPVVTE